MEIRLWEYGNDDKFIESFLNSASLAHKQPIKTKEWFKWKFECNPYGKAILACAFDQETVAGCVALGLGIASYRGKTIKCALSYETFVNPSYQGKGLFKKLISLAEDACKKNEVDYLYNFPNSNSLPGFKHMGWNHIPNEIEYRIKIVKPFNLIVNYKSLKKGFVADKNINSDNQLMYDIVSPPINSEVVTPIWTQEYIKWRFLELPHSRYVIYNDLSYIGIARVGYRGKIKECQILLIQCNETQSQYKHTSSFIKYLKKVEAPTIISMCCAKDSHTSRCLIKVPNHINFTNKILSEDIDIRALQNISGIDFHTY